MPREDKFFDLFSRHSRTVVDAADALSHLLNGESVAANCERIVALENEADDITREVLLAVRRSFITPFDRGDIKDLIQSMDDAIDMMHKTVKTIRLFEQTDFDPLMQQMGVEIVKAAHLIAEAIPLLDKVGANAQRLSAIAEEVTRVEGRSDELHDQGLKDLPQYAVAWAAFFNFIAFLFFGLHVAETLGTGIINPAIVSPQVIFAALMGAIIWNIVTWIFGIPSSSSHALIGGLVGAGLAKVGFDSIVWHGLLKTVAAIFMSPMIGFLLALFLVLVVSWLFVRQTPFAVDRTFRVMQFVSASLYSLGHGGNDAQKTMGIIAVLLFSQGHLGSTFYVPFWVVILCQAAMALGTLFGGWRIVHTMGSKITRLNPMQGFCAETGGALTLFGATWLGIPVSTTHTITGAIIGVGAARRVSAVRWGIAGNIVIAWIVTIPAAALIAAAFYYAAGLLAYRDFLRQQLERREVILLVAETGGTTIGYAYAGLEGYDYMALRGPAGVVYDLFVEPGRRRQGIGRKLLRTAVARLADGGAARVVLSTAQRNEAAQQLFASEGFRPTMVEMTKELQAIPQRET
eukprot:g25283.t1